MCIARCDMAPVNLQSLFDFLAGFHEVDCSEFLSHWEGGGYCKALPTICCLSENLTNQMCDISHMTGVVLSHDSSGDVT